MNLFKMLASGRHKFREEQASVLLTWLLNPMMEHGLGHAFLAIFIEHLSECTKLVPKVRQSLREMREESLVARLRTGDAVAPVFSCDLEYSKEQIDIAIRISDWLFAIENKIYPESVTDGQLSREYTGLLRHLPELAKRGGTPEEDAAHTSNPRVGLIFLVPCDIGAKEMDFTIQEEFDGLTDKQLRPSDFKAIATWQPNDTSNGPKWPSISTIIQTLLEREQKGEIDPIPEYTRHTLKALNAFILSDFAPYQFDSGVRSRGTGGATNPNTEARLYIDKECDAGAPLKERDSGWVGVNRGIAGLFDYWANKELHNTRFQYTSNDMSDARMWMELKDFLGLVNWLCDGKPLSDMSWVERVIKKAKLKPQYLLRIARDYGDRVFIGKQGGLDALRKMPKEEIEKQAGWQISCGQKTRQWISGTSFAAVLDEKGITPIS